MIGARIVLKRGGKEEGERPFWISFADLMTALMVVFLLVMSVALLAVTKEVSDAQIRQESRKKEIQYLLSQLKSDAAQFVGVVVHDDDFQNPFIDFGTMATFDTDRSQLTQEQSTYLRRVIPTILAMANTDKGRRWFKQVVIEGYTDRTGRYLHNLDLSLRRSERLVCVLLDSPPPEEAPLTEDQKSLVKRLFLVGGYSSNSAKADLALSRRIELKLKFRELNEEEPTQSGSDDILNAEVGDCALGGKS